MSNWYFSLEQKLMFCQHQQKLFAEEDIDDTARMNAKNIQAARLRLDLDAFWKIYNLEVFSQ